MVTELVSTAIATKCLYENARMTGNYECAYSLGLLSYLEGLNEHSVITELDSVYKDVMEKTNCYNEYWRKNCFTGRNKKFDSLWNVVRLIYNYL